MNKWKVTAIIFIILFALSCLFIVWAWSVGTTEINNETKCSNEICFNYDAFQYYDGTCYCYTGNEVQYTRYLG